MVNNSYLADGSKAEALREDGTGLVYRGSLIYRKAADGALTLESAATPTGYLTPTGARYHITDHLGSVVGVVDGSNGARLYSSALYRWLTPDPLSEKYYDVSPYAYCAGNPVMMVDPDGFDPIYAKNFWGKVVLIGDDGKNNGESYLVKGNVARLVKTANKQGEFYAGNLSEGKNVMRIPTGPIQVAVQQTATATLNSGDSPDTRVEYGGHALFNDKNARIWDSGTAMQINETLNGYSEHKWSIRPFKIGGKTAKTRFYWKCVSHRHK